MTLLYYGITYKSRVLQRFYFLRLLIVSHGLTASVMHASFQLDERV